MTPSPHHPITLGDWAIVVGIWDYPDLGDLAGPEHDARAFAAWVQAPEGGGVQGDRVRLVLSSDFQPAEVARSAQPTDGQVQALFDELDDLAQANRERGEGQRVGRRLYLYLAGHGCAPLLDESALLMANATRRRAGYHIPGKPWANWFYRAGYFDEILLFMDCCRESYPQAPLNVPAYVDVTAPDAVDRGRRLFAFGTKWSRLSRERPMADGTTRGVFTVALLEGLQGAAAEPSGRITASSLAGYLLKDMKTFLSEEDLADPEIPKSPDVELHPVIDEEFVIVTVPPPGPPAEASFAPLVIESPPSVTTGDAATEIFIFDERNYLVAQGAGELQPHLGPGFYRVEARAGEVTAESAIVLPGGPFSAHFPPLAFASPVPLPNTALSDDAHRQAAIAQSRMPHVRAGAGSQIYVVARDWRAPEARHATAPDQVHPASGLRLLDAAGQLVADIGARSWSDLRERPIAACNVEVAPGHYRLSLTTSDGGRLEQPVIAVAGWQTQVFLLQRADDWVPGRSRLDLNRAAILMANLDHGGRVDAEQPEERLVELLRIGLANRRQVLSDQLRSMLRREQVNPMLGILGGHLLVLDPAADPELLRTLVTTLRAAVAPLRHPDVEALALRLESDGDCTFEMPPMLRRSWSHILEATVERPELVPAGSPAAAIADRIWGGEPWLVWRTEPVSEPDLAFGIPGAGAAEPEESEIDAALRRQLQPEARHAATPDVDFGLEAAGSAEMVQPDEATIRRLVKTLGLPRARVEEMLAQIP